MLAGMHKVSFGSWRGTDHTPTFSSYYKELNISDDLKEELEKVVETKDTENKKQLSIYPGKEKLAWQDFTSEDQSLCIKQIQHWLDAVGLKGVLIDAEIINVLQKEPETDGWQYIIHNMRLNKFDGKVLYFFNWFTEVAVEKSGIKLERKEPDVELGTKQGELIMNFSEDLIFLNTDSDDKDLMTASSDSGSAAALKT